MGPWYLNKCPEWLTSQLKSSKRKESFAFSPFVSVSLSLWFTKEIGYYNHLNWRLENLLLLRSLSVTCYRLMVFSTNKTDRSDITEILLKVVLNTITLTPQLVWEILRLLSLFRYAPLGKRQNFSLLDLQYWLCDNILVSFKNTKV